MQHSLIPYPPTDLAGDPHVDGIVVLVMGALFLCALGYALFSLARTRSPVVLLMFIGGGCMMLMEPLVDTTAGVWFAESSRMFLHGWGRAIPLWVCLTYFVYFGVGSAVLWQMMQRGVSARTIWTIYLCEVLADFVLESVVLGTGIYTYYGDQPLLIGRFPLWWAAVNALISLTSAYAVTQVTRRAEGWQLLLIVPVMVCASAGANAAAGWPAWYVINSGLGPVLTQLGGLASVAIACSIVAMVARSVSVAPRPGAIHPLTPMRAA